MKSLFYFITIIIYIDILCAIKTTKLENIIEQSKKTSNNTLSTNNTDIIKNIRKCSIKYCFICDPFSLNKCLECNKNFELYDDKCLSKTH